VDAKPQFGSLEAKGKSKLAELHIEPIPLNDQISYDTLMNQNDLDHLLQILNDDVKNAVQSKQVHEFTDENMVAKLEEHLPKFLTLNHELSFKKPPSENHLLDILQFFHILDSDLQKKEIQTADTEFDLKNMKKSHEPNPQPFLDATTESVVGSTKSMIKNAPFAAGKAFCCWKSIL